MSRKPTEEPTYSAKWLETSVSRLRKSRGKVRKEDVRVEGKVDGEKMLSISCELVPNESYSTKKFKCRWSQIMPLFMWISVFGILSTVLLKAAVPINANVADEKFLEIRKCPACFGVTLCPAFLTGEIILESWSRLTIAHMLNTRNVFFAKYKDKQVVLKKLGHDSNLKQLDVHILQQTRSSINSFPDASAAISAAVRPYARQYISQRYQTDLQGNSTFLVQHLDIFDSETRHNSLQFKQSLELHHLHGSDALICPSKRKIRFIEDQFVKYNFGLYRLTCLYNLMTVLLHNSEPAIFQAFPPKDGWPFPEYLGACGRVIVEEYIGPNLAEWLPRASWLEKLKAAIYLLKIAEKMTQGVDGFRLYATDVNLYNIAVARDESLKIVDGGNIVLVDLLEIEEAKPTNYNIPYASDNAGCENFPNDPRCVSYNEEEMCNRLVNDHNYFAVCHELFAPADDFGLLGGLPASVYERYPLLKNYQNDCIHSTTPGVRENAAQQLINIYSDIISDM